MRFVLTTVNGTLKGTKAVAMLYNLAKQASFDKQLPENWKTMSKVQRMKFLADYLPTDVKLTCIRETKHTRKDRSLYVKMCHTDKLGPIVDGNVRPPEVLVQQGQGNWQEIDNIFFNPVDGLQGLAEPQRPRNPRNQQRRPVNPEVEAVVRRVRQRANIQGEID